MPEVFDFLIPRRPLSLQTKNRENLQKWKAFVRSEAASFWPLGLPPLGEDVRATLVYLSDEAPVDIDNIVKPILDAIVGLVLIDDDQVSELRAYRRSRIGHFDITTLPPLLIAAIALGQEAVFVRVDEPTRLEDSL